MIIDGYDPSLDLLVQVGDIIDGGPASSACVELLKSMQQKYPDNVVVLLGNHEDLLFQAIGKHEGQSALRMWWYQGGEATYYSYNKRTNNLPFLYDVGGIVTPKEKFQPNTTMFKEHVEWLRTLPLTYETDNFLFVHAGLRPNLTAQATSRHDKLWIREEFHNSAFDWGKVVVYGHTARKDILIESNKIGIDMRWHGSGHVGGVRLKEKTVERIYHG